MGGSIGLTAGAGMLGAGLGYAAVGCVLPASVPVIVCSLVGAAAFISGERVATGSGRSQIQGAAVGAIVGGWCGSLLSVAGWLVMLIEVREATPDPRALILGLTLGAMVLGGFRGAALGGERILADTERIKRAVAPAFGTWLCGSTYAHACAIRFQNSGRLEPVVGACVAMVGAALALAVLIAVSHGPARIRGAIHGTLIGATASIVVAIFLPFVIGPSSLDGHKGMFGIFSWLGILGGAAGAWIGWRRNPLDAAAGSDGTFALQNSPQSAWVEAASGGVKGLLAGALLALILSFFTMLVFGAYGGQGGAGREEQARHSSVISWIWWISTLGTGALGAALGAVAGRDGRREKNL